MINTLTIETPCDFFKRLDEVSKLFPENIWFRGHCASAWPLVPKVHRRFDKLGETRLLNAFRIQAPSRHRNCPESIYTCDWMILMQHYGLPTRLLDWSESFLIVAFFAMAYEENQSEIVDAAIWAIEPTILGKCEFDESAITFLADPHLHEFVNSAFDPFHRSNKRIAAPAVGPEIDPRMMLQHSRYTIHENKTALEEHPNAHDFLIKLVIPKMATGTLKDSLAKLGIRRSNIFPDLTNLAVCLVEQNDRRSKTSI